MSVANFIMFFEWVFCSVRIMRLGTTKSNWLKIFYVGISINNCILDDRKIRIRVVTETSCIFKRKNWYSNTLLLGDWDFVTHSILNLFNEEAEN